MFKPISRPQHGFADYAYVAAVSAAPSLFDFPEEQTASLLCRVLSSAILVSSIFTRAEWGFIRILPYKAHLTLDFAGSILTLISPWPFGFAGNARARNTFLIIGLLGLIAALLSEPEEMPGNAK